MYLRDLWKALLLGGPWQGSGRPLGGPRRILLSYKQSCVGRPASLPEPPTSLPETSREAVGMQWEALGRAAEATTNLIPKSLIARGVPLMFFFQNMILKSLIARGVAVRFFRSQNHKSQGVSP